MKTNLALKYRPKQFKDVVGQKAPAVILNAMVEKGILPQTLLFHGPSGVGKTSMARIVAAALNADSSEDVHNLIHPSVLEIDAASNGSVAAIRDLKSRINYQMPGNTVIIIDEAHSMSNEAFDVFLNMLEYPPQGVTFILCTTEFGQLEKAIRHRCTKFRFKAATVAEIAERLSYVNSCEGFEMPDELLNLIAQRSEGSYRESLMLLEQAHAADINTIEKYNELQGEVDYGPSLVQAFMNGPQAALNQLEVVLYSTNAEEIADRLIETLKDLMILKSGVNLLLTGNALDVRIELANRLDLNRLLKGMQVLWELQTKLSSGDKVRNLEMAVVMLGNAMKLDSSNSTGRMTLDQMRRGT